MVLLNSKELCEVEPWWSLVDTAWNKHSACQRLKQGSSGKFFSVHLLTVSSKRKAGVASLDSNFLNHSCSTVPVCCLLYCVLNVHQTYTTSQNMVKKHNASIYHECSELFLFASLRTNVSKLCLKPYFGTSWQKYECLEHTEHIGGPCKSG